MASGAGGPVKALPFHVRRMAATAFGLFDGRIPVEDATTLTWSLSLQRVAQFRREPKSPAGRTVSLLLAVRKSKRHRLRQFLMVQPSLSVFK